MPIPEQYYGICHALAPDQAVERMINFDPSINNEDYRWVLDQYVDKMEDNYENAAKDPNAAEEATKCLAKYEEALALRAKAEAIHKELFTAADEIAQGKDHPHLVLVRRAYDQGAVLFTISSLYNWAKAEFGIDVPEWAQPSRPAGDTPPDSIADSTSADARRNAATWSDVTISFRAHNKLLFSCRGKQLSLVDLEDSGLMNRRYKRLNEAGAALLGLATAPSIKIKRETSTVGISSKTMSGLRASLKKLAQIDSDPFLPHNIADGWKPRFSVEDRRNAGDERAEQKAIHTSLDEEKHSLLQPLGDPAADEIVDDAGTQFLKEHGQ